MVSWAKDSFWWLLMDIFLGWHRVVVQPSSSLDLVMTQHQITTKCLVIFFLPHWSKQCPQFPLVPYPHCFQKGELHDFPTWNISCSVWNSCGDLEAAQKEKCLALNFWLTKWNKIMLYCNILMMFLCPLPNNNHKMAITF